jgi:hypothetical protein
MTPCSLPDINAASTALPYKTFLSYTFIFRKQFYFVISGLKIICHGNPDNNLESYSIYGFPMFRGINRNYFLKQHEAVALYVLEVLCIFCHVRPEFLNVILLYVLAEQG